MLSDIEAAIAGGCETYHDAVTVSDIAYCKDTGIRIANQGQEPTEAVVKYGKQFGLAGYSAWDTSMDSVTSKYG